MSKTYATKIMVAALFNDLVVSNKLFTLKSEVLVPKRSSSFSIFFTQFAEIILKIIPTNTTRKTIPSRENTKAQRVFLSRVSFLDFTFSRIPFVVCFWALLNLRCKCFLNSCCRHFFTFKAGLVS